MKTILVLTKRRYMNKDLLDDRFGRFREIPLELAKRGHRVIGLCLSYQFRNEGWTSDGPVRWKSINAGPTQLTGLARYILQAMRFAQNADAIWACSDSLYGLIGLAAARTHKIPLVFDLYDNFESYFIAKIPLLKQLYRYAVRQSDGITCVSRPLARLVASYGRKGKTILLENAIRKDLFRHMDKAGARRDCKLPRNSMIIGTAGALTMNRGIQTLFQAFEILKSRCPDLHLALAGPRDVPIPLHERIHDMGVLPLERVPVFLNALDVGIICNRAGAFGTYCFPQKAREMMACNVPVVAADVAGTRSLFSDHPEWLFSPEDPGHLAHVVENRLRDQSTEYGTIPTWSDLSDKLTVILQSLKGRNQRAEAESENSPFNSIR
jgi:glycosyltransferase involved in cell wall biosynthesis